MNDMVEEFNHTAGKEKGITINITSVSNSSDIHSALLAAAKGEAGAEACLIFLLLPRNGREHRR